MIRHRKRQVRKFDSSIELLGFSSRTLKLLEILGSGATQSESACRVNLSKSTVSYWAKKFEKEGLLNVCLRGSFKQFQLTSSGAEFLARSSKNLAGSEKLERVVLEDFRVKFPIRSPEKSRIDWRKLGKPRNWEQLGIKIGRVTVEKTSKHIIVHTGSLHGFDVDDLEMDAGRIAERVRVVLEQNFGMELDEGFSVNKPVFRVYSDEARELNKNGTGILMANGGERIGSIDASGGVPHEEYDGKDLIIARLDLPRSVARLERRVIHLEDRVEGIEERVERIEERVINLEKRVENIEIQLVRFGDLMERMVSGLERLSSGFEKALGKSDVLEHEAPRVRDLQRWEDRMMVS